MGSLIATVIGWGVPPRLAKPLIFLLGIALLVGILGLGKCAYDKSVIEKHDLKVEAQQAKDDRKADNAAAEQRREDDARAAQEQKELENVLTKPSATREQRRREFYRCIELQRRARQNGLEPPTCS